MKEMSGKDIEHLVKELETLPNEVDLDQLRSIARENGIELLDDYEYDQNVPEPGLKFIRRKMHTIYRKRFKEIMKLRREVKVRE